MKENLQKKKMKAWAKQNRVWCEKLWGKTGHPDLLLCVRGRLVAVELKQGQGFNAVDQATTDVQRLRLAEISSSGGLAIVASLSAKTCVVLQHHAGGFCTEMWFNTFNDFTQWLLKP